MRRCHVYPRPPSLQRRRGIPRSLDFATRIQTYKRITIFGPTRGTSVASTLKASVCTDIRSGIDDPFTFDLFKILDSIVRLRKHDVRSAYNCKTIHKMVRFTYVRFFTSLHISRISHQLELNHLNDHLMSTRRCGRKEGAIMWWV